LRRREAVVFNTKNINLFGYANHNPILYVDPDGNAIETPWDVINIGMGVASFAANVSVGNVGGAIVDGIGVIVDITAAAVPGVPGGAGTAIKAIRGADKAPDILRANKAVGKLGEEIATSKLKREAAENVDVLAQVTGRFDDGSKVVFDNVLVDRTTGAVKLVNETKTGKAPLSGQQKRFFENSESVTLVGGNARNAKGQNINAATTDISKTRIDFSEGP
jgi:hypothetical protein